MVHELADAGNASMDLVGDEDLPMSLCLATEGGTDKTCK